MIDERKVTMAASTVQFRRLPFEFRMAHHANPDKAFEGRLGSRRYSVLNAQPVPIKDCQLPSPPEAPLFEDSEFKPNEISLGETGNEDFVWRRPFTSKYSLLGGAGLSGLALWGVMPVVRSYCPDFLQGVTFSNQKYNKTGFYFVRLYLKGLWRYVIVDDSFPMHEKTKTLLGTKSLGL
jgi:hypothetical protein